MNTAMMTAMLMASVDLSGTWNGDLTFVRDADGQRFAVYSEVDMSKAKGVRAGTAYVYGNALMLIVFVDPGDGTVTTGAFWRKSNDVWAGRMTNQKTRDTWEHKYEREMKNAPQ